MVELAGWELPLLDFLVGGEGLQPRPIFIPTEWKILAQQWEPELLVAPGSEGSEAGHCWAASVFQTRGTLH